MYKMAHFTETDQQAVLDFMNAHSFVTLIGNQEGNSVATQVPVLIEEVDGKMILQGHIMRKTDHHLALVHNPNALILFTGPHCYVSSSWYSERGQASTWNYMSVHARGHVRFKDELFTLQLLKELTFKYEKVQQHPELLENMAQETYVQPLLKAIVGFEIEIDSLTPIFKLSQNKDEVSYDNIVRHLSDSSDSDSQKIASEMSKRRL